MLFLWSRESTSQSKTTSLFSWLLTTTLLFWISRKLFNIIRGLSPLLRLSYTKSLELKELSETETSVEIISNVNSTTNITNNNGMSVRILHPKCGMNANKKNAYNKIKHNLMELYAGDGSHMFADHHCKMIKTIEQIYYRFTRSGRVYGQYPSKT